MFCGKNYAEKKPDEHHVQNMKYFGNKDFETSIKKLVTIKGNIYQLIILFWQPYKQLKLVL